MNKFYAIYDIESQSWLTSCGRETCWGNINVTGLDVHKAWREYKGNIEQTAKFDSEEVAIDEANKIADDFIANGFDAYFCIFKIEINTLERKLGDEILSKQDVYKILETTHHIKKSVKDFPRSEMCQQIEDMIFNCNSAHNLNICKEADRIKLAKSIENMLTEKGFVR